MLPDQGQGTGRDTGGIARRDLEVRQIEAWSHTGDGDDNRQMAKPRVLGQYGEKRVDDTGAETFAEHDAIEVAGIEMLGGGFDAERPDHPQPLTESHRQRRIGAAPADQQYGRFV